MEILLELLPFLLELIITILGHATPVAALPPPPASVREDRPSGGIQIVSTQNLNASARCPICAQEPSGQVRACPTCGVVLHQDCMQYNGGCGIYGCGAS